MRSLFVLLLTAGSLASFGQNPYSLAAVPEALKTGANVITHFESDNVEVEGLDKVTLRVKKVYTVLTADGRDALVFNVPSSKQISLEDVEIKVYDRNGKSSGKFKKKDLNTVSIGEGLIEDGFVTYYPITPPSYPVTVDLSYELKFKSTLLLPAFHFMGSKESVVDASYTVKVPADINLRYKAKHNTLSPEISEDGKSLIYKWSIKNLPAAEDEEGSASGRDKFPYVNIVADQFSYYGYKGDLSSWKSFGSWIYTLNEGLDALPPDRQQFFQQLVKDAPNEQEKIRAVYHYLQNNFRYVSIQLGIGGFRTFSAAFTDQKKYGDCKALSNYMKAALRSVGIKSYVAVINAEYNAEPVDADFPVNNFNHMILCVPRPKDSIWLECTSSVAGFGELGTFTENRNALLITEDGGVLVPTPQSRSSANQFHSRTEVKLDNDLSALTETVFTTSGEFNALIAALLKEKSDDQKTALVTYLGYRQPDDLRLTGPATEAKLIMALHKLPEFNTGEKYFINPRISRTWTLKLPTADNRKQDYYFQHPFEKRDTTVLRLTENFKPDALPKDKELSTAYTYYVSKSWFNEKENAIYTATTLILKKHKIPAQDYRSVRSFFDAVMQDDAQRIVVNRTGSQQAEKKVF